MAFRFRHFTRTFLFLRHNYPGSCYHISRRISSLHGLEWNSCTPYLNTCIGLYSRRFSTVSQTSQHQATSQLDIVSFIQSNLDKMEGPSHCWFNKVEDSTEFSRRDGVYLVLSGEFLAESGNESRIMFEKIKLLQQRYPTVHFMGFQSSKFIFSNAVNAQLFQIILREFITFPILLSTNNFYEIIDGECYIIFKGFKDPEILYEKDIDLGVLDKAIKELNLQQGNKCPGLVNALEASWIKPVQVIMEPYHSFSLRNLLLYFPACIAIDESNKRLFISDVNHHRIVVSDGDGMILDCIGSSPGFEDGEFQYAKLMRPAASFYHTSENCLYFVDSENHAIRKADLESRVVETLYPTLNNNKTSNSLWRLIVDKLWPRKDVDIKAEEFHSDSFLFPWHIMKSKDNDIYVLTRSCETLWIMDLASGAIKDVVKGFPKILEVCGQMILEKSSVLKQMPYWLQQQVGYNCSMEGMPNTSWMSSVATLQDNVIICDTVGQRLLKLNKTSGSSSSFHFSNFGILGLPYWLSSSLERVYAVGDVLSGSRADHIQNFSLLPGRIDIQLIVDIPEDTVLVDPLKEGSIWRQARGTAVIVLEEEAKSASSEKVGLAQNWYDELDDLASLAPKLELSSEEDEGIISDGKVQEEKICIKCSINTSPGTCEVIINAAIYLKMKITSTEDGDKKHTSRIAHHLNCRGQSRRDQCLQHILASNMDLGDLVFIRPLRAKLVFEILNSPKAKNSKDIILTNSSIEVNVTLK